mmetsp:Transcript_17673/g.30582  ORF Transcript_17673/g.30582 Transcript_17673/m.30582 type:complete len:218 (-) Transcript_17673:285-938(-)
MGEPRDFLIMAYLFPLAARRRVWDFGVLTNVDADLFGGDPLLQLPHHRMLSASPEEAWGLHSEVANWLLLAVPYAKLVLLFELILLLFHLQLLLPRQCLLQLLLLKLPFPNPVEVHTVQDFDWVLPCSESFNVPLRVSIQYRQPILKEILAEDGVDVVVAWRPHLLPHYSKHCGHLFFLRVHWDLLHGAVVQLVVNRQPMGDVLWGEKEAIVFQGEP